MSQTSSPAQPSADTARLSGPRMQVLADRHTPDTPPISMPTRTEIPPPSGPSLAELQQQAWRAGAIGAVNVISKVLAGQMLVLIAIAGAIFLTWQVLGNPDTNRLIALAVYCVAGVGGTVYLATRAR